MDAVTATLNIIANVSRAWLLIIEAASPETKAGLAERMLKDLNDWHARLDEAIAFLKTLGAPRG